MERIARASALALSVLAGLLGLLSLTVVAAIVPLAKMVAALAFVAIALLLFLWIRRGLSGRRYVVALLISGAAFLWAIMDLVSRPAIVPVEFASDGTMLRGELHLAQGSCPCPAAVLIHGSGPGPRWQYRFYARQLAERGIHALAYDKRGSGESEGSLADGGYELYVRNAADAAKTIAAFNDVDPNRLALVGYSEGEWVAPMTAGMIDISAIAIVGPSGLSPVDQGDEQAMMRLSQLGYSDDVKNKVKKLSKMARLYERSGKGREDLLSELAKVENEEWFDVVGNLPYRHELAPYENYAWWRSYMDTDPATIWDGVDVPVLLLKGEVDEHSLGRPSIKRMQKVIRNAKSHLFPDASHILLRNPFGTGKPRMVFADYFDELAAFIRSAPAQPPVDSPTSS